MSKILPPIVLMRTERSWLFERLRMHRKITGPLRYGRTGAEGKPAYDRVTSTIKRLEAYTEDANAEHLVDVSLLAELEFEEGKAEVRAIDDGPHTTEI